MIGGYDDGYHACPCFWGTEPGSLVKRLSLYITNFSRLTVLDAGCGEGKNAIFLARHGARVRAIDISMKAIENAGAAWPDYDAVTWEVADIRTVELPEETYDLVLAYGLLHCLTGRDEVRYVLDKLRRATRPQGYHVVCAFNDRRQDLAAHPHFFPVLLDHGYYASTYRAWNLLFLSDDDLHEVHPHNNVPHVHSLTRLIAQKV